MQIVVRSPAGEREVDVRVKQPDVVVADLVEAVDPSAAEAAFAVVVDGRPVRADLGLDEAGIVHGSIVELVEPVKVEDMARPGRAEAGPQLEFATVGGLAAGRTTQLHAHDSVVGREPAADVVVSDATVSAAHLRVTITSVAVTVDDLGSHNGTRVDGEPIRTATAVGTGSLLQLGAAEAVVRESTHHDGPVGFDPCRAAVAGLVGFNRPPRVALPVEVAPIAVPDAPAPKKRHAAFSVATLIGPIVMGIVMVKLMGNIRFALFALMSPIMFVSTSIATRRRNTKDSKSSQRQFRVDLAAFVDALNAATAQERSRRDVLTPDPAEIVRRAELPSTKLWERRFDHGDYLRLRIGRGPARWVPPVDPQRVGAHADLRAAVEQASVIARCPIDVDLAVGGVVGLVGDRGAAAALARCLVAQACVLHGPADLGVVVLTDRLHAHDWDWAKWLPHTRAGNGEGRYLSTDALASHELMESLLQGAAESEGASRLATGGVVTAPGLLVIVDDDTLTTGRQSPTRAVLRGQGGPVAGIVIASTADRLPAVCDTIVHLLDDLGDAVVQRPHLAEQTTGVVVAGMDDQTARSCARRLARFEDPEVQLIGAGVPSSASLLALLGMPDVDPGQVLDQWTRAGVDPAPSAPVAVRAEGPVELNMVTDGPHGLVGGTTGSGKSEFLRSLVAGMAARISPEQLVFVLVDYKGGSAFDECARLPHTVGMVTDLDEHLGERALRSLDAELHHRETVLRTHGAADLSEYLEAGAPGGPLPRLLVVVDEFATMATDLPDFIGALVGIAQRGRSLGVHMILATQRPSGAVNANIKANTNMRIALRMQDSGDSMDVIDRPDAARISRSTPGRAFVRLGATEVVAVQTALVTGNNAPCPTTPLSVSPFRFGPQPSSPDVGCAATSGPSDLVRLVDACVQAFAQSGLAPPRRPWMEMLDESIQLADVLADADRAHGVALGRGDNPGAQRRDTAYWDPAGGHLALLGTVGSGTTSALVATALSAANVAGPDNLHMFAIDFGGGALLQLRELPHVGAVVLANERERQVRLVRYLADEVTRRRDLGSEAREAEPQVVVLVDGLPALLSDFDDLDGQETVDRLKRVIAEGAAVGIAFVLSADRPLSIPMPMMSAVTKRLMFRHADRGDFAPLGLRQKDLPAFVPGRAIDSESGLVVQVSDVADAPSLIALLAARCEVRRPPASIEALPTIIEGDALADHLCTGTSVSLPIGVAECDRAVRLLQLYPGENLFVAGQARSGVSTTLRLWARWLKQARPGAVMVAVAHERSPLREDLRRFDAVGSADQLAKVFELAKLDREREWIVVVDDAHLVEDPHGLEHLVKEPHCCLVVGGRAEQLHGQFSHWSRAVRRNGAGVLLQPRLDADGDLLGVRLPRRLSVPLVPGRGFLVADGESTLIQLAGVDLMAS